MSEKKRYPNQHGDKLRVKLAGGPLVCHEAHQFFRKHNKNGLSIGVIIDRLVDFATFYNYDPSKNNLDTLKIPWRSGK
jgi:hypothetical protein